LLFLINAYRVLKNVKFVHSIDNNVPNPLMVFMNNKWLSND
jgi:hypothetical protein